MTWAVILWDLHSSCSGWVIPRKCQEALAQSTMEFFLKAIFRRADQSLVRSDSSSNPVWNKQVQRCCIVECSEHGIERERADREVVVARAAAEAAAAGIDRWDFDSALDGAISHLLAAAPCCCTPWVRTVCLKPNRPNSYSHARQPGRGVKPSSRVPSAESRPLPTQRAAWLHWK